MIPKWTPFYRTLKDRKSILKFQRGRLRGWSHLQFRIPYGSYFGDICDNFDRSCPSTQSPTQKLEHGLSTLKSQGILPILVSFLMIFKALQGELFRIKIDSLGYKIPKFSEFNLDIMGVTGGEKYFISKLVQSNRTTSGQW